MLGRVSRVAVATRRLTAVFGVAGACSGTVSVGTNDGGDGATTTGALPFDATGTPDGLNIDGTIDSSSSSPSGSGLSSDLNNPSSWSNPGVSFCPSSCRLDTDCAFCPLPRGNSKNCCVMGICVMYATCPRASDSGVDAQDAADLSAPDADGSACTTVYQPCDAQVCCEGMRCLGNGTCEPIP